MFDKKTKNPKDESILAGPAKVVSIPDIFYGGADPQIYHSQEKTMAAGGVGGEGKKLWRAPKGFFHDKKVWYVLFAVFFIICVGLISWYYLRMYYSSINAMQTVTPRSDEQTAPPADGGAAGIIQPVAPETGTTTELMEAVEDLAVISTLDSESGIPLSFPKDTTLDSADVDVDLLTDIEEELFSTDSGAWDTDGDGYYDGKEIINLYSPKGFAPTKLIDSGLIQEYVNPRWQYRVYYPVGWEAAAVDAKADQVVFSSISGDYIEIAAVERDRGQTFDEWFGLNAPGQQFADLISFDNAFKQPGYSRRDSLVAYFVEEKVVYVMIYHPGADDFIPYRQAMIMMWWSFRPAKTSADLPEQAVLPVEPPDSFAGQEEVLAPAI